MPAALDLQLFELPVHLHHVGMLLGVFQPQFSALDAQLDLFPVEAGKVGVCLDAATGGRFGWGGLERAGCLHHPRVRAASGCDAVIWEELACGDEEGGAGSGGGADEMLDDDDAQADQQEHADGCAKCQYPQQT